MPQHLLLDLDGTDDPTHGKQEGGAYQGYYREPMYHPPLALYSWYMRRDEPGQWIDDLRNGCFANRLSARPWLGARQPRVMSVLPAAS